jgi:hypothetical protein
MVSIWYVLTRNELYDGNRAELRERKLKNLKRIAAQ